MLDASVVLAAHMPDEKGASALALFSSNEPFAFHVSQIWHIEIGNAMLMAVRRNRLPENELEVILTLLGKLGVVVDVQTQKQAWAETLLLAKRHRLTLYDASYLELAMRIGGEVATVDDRLASAAQSEGIKLSISR